MRTRCARRARRLLPFLRGTRAITCFVSITMIRMATIRMGTRCSMAAEDHSEQALGYRFPLRLTVRVRQSQRIGVPRIADVIWFKTTARLAGRGE
jgi:hypothetical protein